MRGALNRALGHFQRMNLQCKIDLALGYKAGPQIARVLSEDWCARELYCPACDSDQLLQSKPNSPAVDFNCGECQQLFQLKSLRGWNPNKIVDGGYDAMIRAIKMDRTPNLLVLQYSSSWLIQNLLLVPRVFFVESVVEKRNPLRPQAKRAGWVGCNILLNQIPPDGRIAMVSAGVPVRKERVRQEFSRISGLGELPSSLRGWTVDVLNAVRQIGKSRFSLQELYEFESAMKSLHPKNQNVRPKMRQQLQVLRDLGLLDFVSPGHYRMKS